MITAKQQDSKAVDVLLAAAATYESQKLSSLIGSSTTSRLWCSVWSVPTRLRPLASGVSPIASHVLGDVPTPPLVGLLQGELLHFAYSLTAECRGAIAYQCIKAIRLVCKCGCQ